jgi:type VI secretion system protein ImpA
VKPDSNSTIPERKEKLVIDIDALLSPIPGDNPAGEDLRYAPIYDEIKEARRADDPLERGDWEREIKTADWDKVIALSTEAITEKTKDLQLAAWLTEALTKTAGLKGFLSGLKVLNGLLLAFWDTLYPEIDEGDLDYRIGPLEFFNNTLWLCLKETPITDPKTTPGHSWLKWQESRQVGYEKDTLNQYGDVDGAKKAKRDELIADGKLKAEDFDSSVAASSKTFYEDLSQTLVRCKEEFRILDETVDDKFGNEAPRLSEIRQSLEDIDILLSRISKEKGINTSESEPETQQEPSPETSSPIEEKEMLPEDESQALISGTPKTIPPVSANDTNSFEEACWQDALNTFHKAGIREGLARLRDAALGAPSIRQQNRYRLLMAKLCLRADRADLARPIVEELHTLVEGLNLEQWESPMWIAEILDAYYQCLTAEGASDEDMYKAHNELFQRLCTKDITKAIAYKA